VILYLYALADAIDRVDGVTGVYGEAPAVIALPVCVVVAGWIETRPPIARETLTRQDAVVRRVHALAPAVLPVRFGTAAADADAAARSRSWATRSVNASISSGGASR
jgi:Gas vesicle synthesis protein GvpL/GvpF